MRGPSAPRQPLHPPSARTLCLDSAESDSLIRPLLLLPNASRRAPTAAGTSGGRSAIATHLVASQASAMDARPSFDGRAAGPPDTPSAVGGPRSTFIATSERHTSRAARLRRTCPRASCSWYGVSINGPITVPRGVDRPRPPRTTEEPGPIGPTPPFHVKRLRAPATPRSARRSPPECGSDPESWRNRSRPGPSERRE